MTYKIFDDMDGYVYEETKWLDDFLDDLDQTDYDKNHYIDEYRLIYCAKLDSFFNNEWSGAFEFSNPNTEEELAHQLNQQKKEFLLDIYSYASFGDFLSFNDYKKAAGVNGNALNYLCHIPQDFHLELYQNHQELFEDLKFSEIEAKVEELFFELHNELYDKFEAKIAMLNDTLALFRPYDMKELELLLEYFSPNIIDMKNVLKADNEVNICLIEKNEYLMTYLQQSVFDDIYMPNSSQQAYDKNSIIFDEPCIKDYVLKAKEALEILDYEVAVFELVKNKDLYIFAYAKNEKDLEFAFDYLNKQKDDYSFDSKKSTKDYLALYSKDDEYYQSSLFSEEELHNSKAIQTKSYDELMEQKMRKRGRV